jgi:flagellar motor switch protein FliN
VKDVAGAGVTESFVGELAAVIGAVIEAPASIATAGASPAGGWVLTLQARDGARGSFRIHVERSGIEPVVKRATGQQTEPTSDEVVRALREWCSEAANAFLQRSPFGGARLVVSSVDDAAAPEKGADSYTLTIGDFTIYTAIAGQLDGEESAAAGHRSSGGQNLDAILDIDLPLVVRFGRTEMTLKALAALGPGSVIDLGRSPDDPVDVLVSNQLVARGEVVTVAGSYGVRITDVITPRERMHSIEERLR